MFANMKCIPLDATVTSVANTVVVKTNTSSTVAASSVESESTIPVTSSTKASTPKNLIGLLNFLKCCLLYARIIQINQNKSFDMRLRLFINNSVENSVPYIHSSTKLVMSDISKLRNIFCIISFVCSEHLIVQLYAIM